MKSVCRSRHCWQSLRYISIWCARRSSTSLALILESGEPSEVHHFATLLGYGASAVNPYLALDTIHQLIDSGDAGKGLLCGSAAITIQAIIDGIVKIASKMGISTIQSYQGSQIFEAIGISSEVIDKYFTNTVSRVGGISLKDIENDVDTRHTKAFDPLGTERGSDIRQPWAGIR